MKTAWHWNCVDCGMTGGASGTSQSAQLNVWLARKHADKEQHHVRVWPRGERGRTYLVMPSGEELTEEG